MPTPASARISVRVTPRGGRNSIDAWDGDVLRVRVAAAPADGLANTAVIALLAKALALPKSSVTIASGGSSRTKLVDVSGMSLAEVRDALGAARMTDYVWQPLTPHEVQATFAPLGIDWWIAGGVAIDLFVGRKTREHGDIDVAALRRDVVKLRALLDAWDVCIAHQGVLTPWDGADLTPEQHQFWVRRRGAEAWSFEILLEATDGNDLVYRRDARVRAPLTAICRRTPDGISYLAPEICLLYKSTATDAARYTARNFADFDVALPVLNGFARAWLREALNIINPEHPWIPRL